MTDMTHTLDALIALASGDDGLPDDLRADVERLRAILSCPAVPELWCMHVIGPDDVHPAPSKAHAEKAVAWFNERFGPLSERSGVRVEAVVAPWPHDAESHAASVGTFITDWLVPQTPAPAVPEGWKPVPVEPTEKMLGAGLDRHWPQTMGGGRLALLYRAMIAAAPEPVSEPEGGPVAVIRLIPGSSPRSDLESHPVIALHRPNAREVSLQQDDDTNVVQWHVQSPDGSWRAVGHRFSLPSEVAIRTRLWHENQALRERVRELEADAAMLDQMQDECWNVECEAYPIADSGDSDIEWRVFSSHMAEPRRREIGYGRTPREALNAAMQEDGNGH